MTATSSLQPKNGARRKSTCTTMNSKCQYRGQGKISWMTFCLNRKSLSSQALRRSPVLQGGAVNTTGRRKVWVSSAGNSCVCMDVKTKVFFCLINVLMSSKLSVDAFTILSIFLKVSVSSGDKPRILTSGAAQTGQSCPSRLRSSSQRIISKVKRSTSSN